MKRIIAIAALLFSGCGLGSGSGYVCPSGYPIDCGNGGCCPAGTYCVSGGLCQGYYDEKISLPEVSGTSTESMSLLRN